MIYYENECVGCSSLGLPCYGATCPNRNVPHIQCDKCHTEAYCDEDEAIRNAERFNELTDSATSATTYEHICDECLDTLMERLGIDPEEEDN